MLTAIIRVFCIMTRRSLTELCRYLKSLMLCILIGAVGRINSNYSWYRSHPFEHPNDESFFQAKIYPSLVFYSVVLLLLLIGFIISKVALRKKEEYGPPRYCSSLMNGRNQKAITRNGRPIRVSIAEKGNIF